MNLRIYGENRKIGREEMRFATRTMARFLFSPRLLRNLTVNVHQMRNLTLSGYPVHACVAIKDKRYPPRKFTVWLDTTQGKRAQLRSMAHELTHIKQYALGEARYLKNGLVRWKDSHKRNTTSFFTPWEVDATGHEDALYYAYLDAKRKEGRRGTARGPRSRRGP